MNGEPMGGPDRSNRDWMGEDLKQRLWNDPAYRDIIRNTGGELPPMQIDSTEEAEQYEREDTNNFQMRCAKWMRETFEPEVCADHRERGFRFGEEAIELLQANGATKEEVLRLVDYVYGRPVGEIPQEIGGVMVTLTALCEARKIDVMSCAWAEQLRCERPEVRAKIQGKQAAKRAMTDGTTSPLPGSVDKSWADNGGHPILFGDFP